MQMTKNASSTKKRDATTAAFNVYIQIDRQTDRQKKSYRYLGLPISADLHCDVVKSEWLDRVNYLFAQVDKPALSHFNKCQLYKKAVLPRLAGLLSIFSLPLSWIQSHLDTVVTRCLKKFVGLAHCTILTRLFLNTNRGGFHLPRPFVLFHSLQCSCLLRFTNSNNVCLRTLASANFSDEAQSLSSRFLLSAFLLEHSLTCGFF